MVLYDLLLKIVCGLKFENYIVHNKLNPGLMIIPVFLYNLMYCDDWQVIIFFEGKFHRKTAFRVNMVCETYQSYSENRGGVMVRFY